MGNDPSENGLGHPRPSEAQRQAALQQIVAPRPVPTAYSIKPARFQAPGSPDLFLIEEVIYSANGKFSLYWDVTSAKQKAAQLRQAAAQADRWKGGLWTPDNDGGSGLVVP